MMQQRGEGRGAGGKPQNHRGRGGKEEGTEIEKKKERESSREERGQKERRGRKARNEQRTLRTTPEGESDGRDKG
jgi:hypothetical protein